MFVVDFNKHNAKLSIYTLYVVNLRIFVYIHMKNINQNKKETNIFRTWIPIAGTIRQQ